MGNHKQIKWGSSVELHKKIHKYISIYYMLYVYSICIRVLYTKNTEHFQLLWTFYDLARKRTTRQPFSLVVSDRKGIGATTRLCAVVCVFLRPPSPPLWSNENTNKHAWADQRQAVIPLLFGSDTTRGTPKQTWRWLADCRVTKPSHPL